MSQDKIDRILGFSWDYFSINDSIIKINPLSGLVGSAFLNLK